MKFSVLIAHYNHANFFKECYDSLMKQTYTNWEAIILDDASRAEEKKAVLEMIANDPRFVWHENKQNSGVGITKSKLIDLASGEICGFLDPDDALLPNAIELAINAFQKDNALVLTYSQFMSCDEELNPIKPFAHAKQVVNFDPYFFNFPVQIAHFVCFKKSVYLTTEKMDSTKKIAEDQDLYLKMYEKGKVQYIPSANYLYRTHQAGISQNENKKKSYEYWGEVIYNAMKRRGIKKINGQRIPEEFSNSEEIFKLLDYQNSILYRIKNKIKLLFQK